MKKLLLTSTSILAVAFASQAFAGGSSSYTSQTGNNQQATITQSATGNNNQVGTLANPFLQQNGVGAVTGGTGGNVISITQTGSDNHVVGEVGYLHPAAPAGAAGQSGTNNHATIQQNGVNGDVVLQQNGHNNGTTAGYGGSIIQSATTGGDHVYVRETGDNNDFNIKQSNTGSSQHNRVTLIQGFYDSSPASIGSNNLAIISQTGGPSTGHSLNSKQYGAYNRLNSIQTGTGLTNSFTSSQTNSGGTSATPNSITNNQTGSGDAATVNQDGNLLVVTNAQSGTLNTLNVIAQTGTMNNIANTQSGSSNTATVTGQAGNNEQISNKQTGNNGTATYSQTGAYNIATLQDQKGSGNTFSANQSGVGGNGYTNVILAGQNGDNNTIDMTQSGDWSNKAYLAQGFTIGGTAIHVAAAQNGNHITGVQGGNSNTAFVSQNSNGNTGSFSQTGVGNTTTVKQ